MSTYTQILYQLVFSTYNREQTLHKKNREEIFKYIQGILHKQGCHLYRINGTSDHIHIAFELHPMISLADLVKDIKLASSKHIKKEGLFPDFRYWQEGYGAFTYGITAKNNLINYIINQEKHHEKKTFREEYIELLNQQGIQFEERFLF